MRSVLVTGATGFLGGHLARNLAADGVEIRGLGRNPVKGAALISDGVAFTPVALEDQAGLLRACRGVDVVVHTAALSTAWATKTQFYRGNVVGTAAILDAARRAGVERFIHVSTPAVLSRFAHQLNVLETAPLPTRHTSEYGASKAAAERIVAAAGIETAIIRPKAIYGPGDTALLPRLIRAARQGRLRVIGDGSTLTDMTHVSDVVRAIRAMIQADTVSGVYHVVGPEPVPIWEMIDLLLPMLGFEAPRKRISIGRAMRVATVLEAVWRTLRLGGEPPLTRYSVAAVAYSQTLDTTRTRRELGFEPQVQGEDGLAEVVAAYHRRSKPSTAARQNRAVSVATRVQVSFTLGGKVRPPGWSVGDRTLSRTMLPVVIAAIRHPNRGVVLFDTGYGSRTPGQGIGTWWPYRWMLRPEPISLVDALRRCGIKPHEVGAVVLSHFDPDHCGDLATVTNATVYCSAAMWTDVARHREGSWLRRIPPDWLPSDLAARVVVIDAAGGPTDLFGDGSIQVVPLSGHALGHIGLEVAAVGELTYLLCADAVWSLANLGKKPSLIARLVARDGTLLATTSRWLADRRASDPGLVVVPSHCRDTADVLLGSGWRDMAESAHV